MTDANQTPAEPGTPLAIIGALFDFAEAECGHNRFAAQHALTTVEAWVANAKAEIAKLRKMLAAVREKKGRTVVLIEFASDGPGGPLRLVVTHPDTLMESVFVAEIGGLICQTLKTLAVVESGEPPAHELGGEG